MKISVFMTRWEKILGWVLMALHLLFLPILVVLVCDLASIPLTNATLNITVFIIGFILTVCVFHRFLWHNLQSFLQDLKRSIYAALGGFGIYYVLNIFVSIIITNMAPAFSNVNDANIAQMSQDNYPMMLLCTVLLVPVTEETLYRGMLFQGLYRRGRILAYVVSTLIFAAIHIVNYIGYVEPWVLLLCSLQYIPAGIGLAYAYEKADSIFAPILIHCFVNLIGMLYMR